MAKSQRIKMTATEMIVESVRVPSFAVGSGEVLLLAVPETVSGSVIAKIARRISTCSDVAVTNFIDYDLWRSLPKVSEHMKRMPSRSRLILERFLRGRNCSLSSVESFGYTEALAVMMASLDEGGCGVVELSGLDPLGTSRICEFAKDLGVTSMSWILVLRLLTGEEFPDFGMRLCLCTLVT